MLTFAGVSFKNPFVVASSPLTARLDLLKKADQAGAAAASTKLTFIKQPFYGKLRMYNDPRVGSIVCHDKRLDLEEGVRLVAEAKKHTSLVIFANITHSSDDLEGWARLGRAMEEAGADLVEANLVCPNVGLTARRLGLEATTSGAIAGQDPAAVRSIARALKESVRIPVVCKLTPNVTDVAVIAQAAVEGGANGVTLAGAQASLPPVDIYNPTSVYPLLEGASFGSLGGPAARLMGYAAIAHTSRRVGCPIVGGGGLETWRHGIEFMMWGATLVTACTSVMWWGFDVITRCVRGMEEFLVAQGYGSFAEIVGLALPTIRPASALEPLPQAPTVLAERCNGCGVCLKPGHCTAIALRDGVAEVSAPDCLGCSICVAICPRGAIVLPERVAAGAGHA